MTIIDYPIPGGRLLTAREERALARRASRGDVEAYRLLVERNLRLAKKIALEFRQPPGMERDDLVASGALGLCHAARKFDAARGCRFSTYATWWIKQSVRRAIREARMVSVPEYAYSIRPDKRVKEDTARAIDLFQRGKLRATSFEDLGDDVREARHPDLVDLREADRGRARLTTARAAEALRLLDGDRDKRAGQMARLRIRGMTLVQIGRRFNVCRNRVRKILAASTLRARRRAAEMMA